MKLHTILKIASILCYCLIFVPGSMIALPFILILILGIPDAYPIQRELLIIADLALILLLILSRKHSIKNKVLLEPIIYFLLLSPLAWTLAKFPEQLLTFKGFMIPFIGFVILYPASLILSRAAPKQARA